MAPYRPSGTAPPVTLLVPLYQERRFIEPLCDTLDRQTWPADRLEVLFLDGGSTDGTREYLAQRVFACAARVVDNPRRLQVHALNLGLGLATGDFVLRWDAHADYAEDYIERCVSLLEEEPDVVDCGGTARAVGFDFTSGVIADLLGSPLGVGAARFRYATKRTDADTVFPGAFRRCDLLSAGGWDGRFAVAEDAELSIRLRKSTGMRIVVDPAIRVSYYPRNSVAGLSRQYARFGLYRLRLARVHPEALRPTHLPAVLLLPAVVVCAATGLALLFAARSPWGWLLLSPAPLYAVCALAVSALLSRGPGRRPAERLKRTAYGAVCLGAMHFSWSAGAFRALLERRSVAWRDEGVAVSRSKSV